MRGLRHSSEPVCSNASVTMLGHASAAMTLDTYADLLDDDLDDVALALNSARISALTS